MSTFEDDRYRWRETYFVLFPSDRRPTLKTVEKRLGSLNKRYSLENLSADEDGMVESLTLHAPDDFAAMDICFISGDEVLEHNEELVQELAATVEPEQKSVLRRIKQYDGRFDVLHFEQKSDAVEEVDEEGDEMLDPGALLAVLEQLARITGGVAIDPQSGTILSTEE